MSPNVTGALLNQLLSNALLLKGYETEVLVYWPCNLTDGAELTEVLVLGLFNGLVFLPAWGWTKEVWGLRVWGQGLTTKCRLSIELCVFVMFFLSGFL